MLNGAGPSSRVTLATSGSLEAAINQMRDWRLEDGRLRNEQPFEALWLPTPRGVMPYVPRAYTHQESNALQGKSYFEYMSKHSMLSPQIKAFINYRFLGGSRHGLTQQEMTAALNKLRPIIAQALHRVSQRDATLVTELSNEAYEGARDCSDRMNYYIERMQTIAMIDDLNHLDSGCRDDDLAINIRVFNAGVSLCALELVRTEFMKLQTSLGLTEDSESLESAIHVEYQLTQPLRLPLSLSAPQYSVSSTTAMLNHVTTIKNNVKRKMLAEDGAAVFSYLGTFEPWQRRVSGNKMPFSDEKPLVESFIEEAEKFLADRSVPGTYPSILSEAVFNVELNKIRAQADAAKEVYFGQVASQFHRNLRAELVLDTNQGANTTYFQSR